MTFPLDDVTIIDNFLADQEYSFIRDLVMNTRDKVFPFFIQHTIAHPEEDIPGHWSWMAFHMLYHNDEPTSQFYQTIAPIFKSKFISSSIYKGMLRMKCNFYPHTSELHEHDFHTDYDFTNLAAVYSINTCDGYTLMRDGTKINSIGNRIVFFDGSKEHASTTTTNSFGRFNINFNLVA